MKLTKDEWMRGGAAAGCLGQIVIGSVFVLLSLMAVEKAAPAQTVATTTVQGTVYLANGQAGAGSLDVSWPSFTTAAGQAVVAGRIDLAIPPDGFVSVSLTPNLGATPAGLYYTAVFQMSDGSTNTQYWVVPAAAQASLAQVQATVMPAAQAVQAVSKAYVDQSVSQLAQSLLTANGGTLTGPLTLAADPTQPLQAADKHYVDTQVATAVPLAGGNMTGALETPAVNGVEAPEAASAQTTLQQAMTAAGATGAMEIPPTYAGTDTFTNLNGVRVTDLRTTGAQQVERSVKEWGAVCDGVTDDTNALQEAINYAQTHAVALTIPEGTCKTRQLNWHGESIGGLGKQVSALMGFPGQDVLSTVADSTNLLSYTRVHDLTIYVDQSVDVSCSAAEGRAPGGSCGVNRPLETNSIFSPGGNGLTGVAGMGAGWSVGNCAIAMPAATGLGGNGLRNASIENVEIATVGVDPMAGQYLGAHSTHTCGLYFAMWPQWSEFRNIDIRGLNTGIAIPALPVTTPTGLHSDSNRWQNITMQTTHGFQAGAGSNNVLDNVVVMAGNSAATGETPTGLVLDFGGAGEYPGQGWTVRNAVVLPSWIAVQPQLTVTAAGGAVTAVTVGPEHGLGFDPYGMTVPLAFSGSCTAQANAAVNANGSLSAVTVTAGGVGCSGTTTATVNVASTWDTVAPVNLIGGQNMTFFAGNLLKGNGGYTVWNATGSQSSGTQLAGGGGVLPGGGAYPAMVVSGELGSSYQVDQFPGVDFGAKLQACLNTLSATNGGTCDARNFQGMQAMGSNLTIATGNATVLLPCATIQTANQIVVTAGPRNVSLRGCALRGGSQASGNTGGTVLAYSGTGAMVQVGDPTYAVDTPGFHLDNAVISTAAATSATALGLVAYRTQEMDLESLYFLGNPNQTAMTLDGTGNYTGGTFYDNQIDGFQMGVNAVGHQVANPATTDWMNASEFVRLHIDCPTSGGNPIAGTTGINLQQGDGNTFTGGDVENCATALHLGANAQNNTIVGLRNENSTNQVVADAGSSYNSWITGGTMFTGKLTDNGTRNSFLDTFHRSFNGLNGDWYGSQQDATVTNHYRLGIGTGNERGLLNEYQTDYGYRWITGLSDATAGEQNYQIQDLLNNVYRISIGQYNNGQSSTNNQTVINSAGTGAVVLNGSTNAGTGGVVFGSGGTSEQTVATLSNAGNAQLNGTLQVGGTAQSAGTMTVRNNADAEVDYYLWPGLTTSQKGSFTYKDWNGNSQWYLLKDQYNNWAVNSAVGGLDSFKAYQSTNSGDTYVNASNSTGHIRLNYENGSGVETDIYSNGALDAAFLGTTSVKLPGLAASTGHNCLQIDNSGYITNTGAACGVSTGGGGTVNTGSAGQLAYYSANGTAVSGMTVVPVTAGGTGAATAAGAMAILLPGVTTNGTNGLSVAGNTQLTGPLQVNGEATFSGTPAIKAPGLAAASGYNCLQVDNTGNVTNTGSACGAGSGGSGSGTVNAGATGQIAYYAANGAAVTGENAVPVTAGGTGATTANTALTNLGAQSLMPGVSSDGANGLMVAGAVTSPIILPGGGTSAQTVNGKLTNSISYLDMGGVADAVFCTDAATTANSAVITSPSGCFAGATTGKSVALQNAGIFATVPTILTVTSANQVTLSEPAPNTIPYVTISTTSTSSGNFTASIPTGLATGQSVSVTGMAGTFTIATLGATSAVLTVNASATVTNAAVSSPSGASLGVTMSSTLNSPNVVFSGPGALYNYEPIVVAGLGNVTILNVGTVAGTFSANAGAVVTNAAVQAATMSGISAQWGTDNTSILNSAIATISAAGPNSPPLYVPRGQYLFTGTVQMLSNVTVQLDPLAVFSWDTNHGSYPALGLDWQGSLTDCGAACTGAVTPPLQMMYQIAPAPAGSKTISCATPGCFAGANEPAALSAGQYFWLAEGSDGNLSCENSYMGSPCFYSNVRVYNRCTSIIGDTCTLERALEQNFTGSTAALFPCYQTYVASAGNPNPCGITATTTTASANNVTFAGSSGVTSILSAVPTSGSLTGTGTIQIYSFNNSCQQASYTLHLTAGAIDRTTGSYSGWNCSSPPTTALCYDGNSTGTAHCNNLGANIVNYAVSATVGLSGIGVGGWVNIANLSGGPYQVTALNTSTGVGTIKNASGAAPASAVISQTVINTPVYDGLFRESPIQNSYFKGGQLIYRDADVQTFIGVQYVVNGGIKDSRITPIYQTNSILENGAPRHAGQGYFDGSLYWTMDNTTWDYGEPEGCLSSQYCYETNNIFRDLSFADGKEITDGSGPMFFEHNTYLGSQYILFYVEQCFECVITDNYFAGATGAQFVEDLGGTHDLISRNTVIDSTIGVGAATNNWVPYHYSLGTQVTNNNIWSGSTSNCIVLGSYPFAVSATISGNSCPSPLELGISGGYGTFASQHTNIVEDNNFPTSVPQFNRIPIGQGNFIRYTNADPFSPSSTGLGDYQQGDILIIQPTPGSNYTGPSIGAEYVTVSGTLGPALSGVTATTTSGSPNVTFNSIGNLTPGNWINISGGGGPYQIATINTMQIAGAYQGTLNTVASTSVTNGAVSWQTPAVRPQFPLDSRATRTAAASGDNIAASSDLWVNQPNSGGREVLPSTVAMTGGPTTTSGKMFVVENTSGGSVSLCAGDTTQSIGGAPVQSSACGAGVRGVLLPNKYDFLTVQWDGTNYDVMGGSPVALQNAGIAQGNQTTWNFSLPSAQASGVTYVVPIASSLGMMFNACSGNSCIGTAQAAAASGATVTLYKNGASFCTATYIAGATTPTFSCPSTTAFSQGDMLKVVYSGDANLVPSVSFTVVN
jgi:hypothetical protein